MARAFSKQVGFAAPLRSHLVGRRAQRRAQSSLPGPVRTKPRAAATVTSRGRRARRTPVRLRAWRAPLPRSYPLHLHEGTWPPLASGAGSQARCPGYEAGRRGWRWEVEWAPGDPWVPPTVWAQWPEAPDALPSSHGALWLLGALGSSSRRSRGTESGSKFPGSEAYITRPTVTAGGGQGEGLGTGFILRWDKSPGGDRALGGDSRVWCPQLDTVGMWEWPMDQQHRHPGAVWVQARGSWRSICDTENDPY